MLDLHARRDLGPGDRNGGIYYLVIDEVATLAWVGNMASLEVHAPMARADDIDSPTMVVFDLDPGPGAAMPECCRVALEFREVLDDLGLAAWAKIRKNKVFVDWSQNSFHKTTIAAYSLRARPAPTVSTPVAWDEVEAGAEGEELSFTAPEVLERVADLGDLFAPTATLQQQLPSPR